MLELTNLVKHFGGLMAVAGASLAVAPGQIVGLIGPNGSGKSTLLSTIAGQYRPDGGSIRFEGAEIGGLSPTQIFRRGIGRSYQDPALFFRMSVLDNALLPAQDQVGERPTVAPRRRRWWSAGAGRRRRRRSRRPRSRR